MPNDREPTSSKPTGRRATEGATERHDAFWNVVGVGFAWTVGMAVWPKNSIVLNSQ